MNSNNYDALIGRILTHCQQTIQDAKPGLGWRINTRNYERWYVPGRKTCVVLRPEEYGEEPTLAFPPATEQQIRRTEQQLGFSLPPLLRLLYTQIANGGFGPGYGIIGAAGGYGGVDFPYGGIARRYQWAVDFADALKQWYKGGWTSLTPKGQQVLWKHGIGSRELWEAGQLTDDDSETGPGEEQGWLIPWPEYLLPLVVHGCNIITYIYAHTEQIVQGMHDPYLTIADSLEEWLERWLAGENLQFM